VPKDKDKEDIAGNRKVRGFKDEGDAGKIEIFYDSF